VKLLYFEHVKRPFFLIKQKKKTESKYRTFQNVADGTEDKGEVVRIRKGKRKANSLCLFDWWFSHNSGR
jgi:hypothetical protein